MCSLFHFCGESVTIEVYLTLLSQGLLTLQVYTGYSGQQLSAVCSLSQARNILSMGIETKLSIFVAITKF